MFQEISDEDCKDNSVPTLVSAVSLVALAGSTGETEMEKAEVESMPMMRSQQGSIPMMNMMYEKQAMIRDHMKKMETHMANTEELLKQLVELQKK